jgi:hypothetical protein
MATPKQKINKIKDENHLILLKEKLKKSKTTV